MATVTSSLLGASLTADDSTALFALGTTLEATDEQQHQYVCCSGTFTTGYAVLVNTAGTAFALTTAMLTGSAINSNGYSIGFVQNTVSQSQFGWIAKKGRNLYILCTGTCTAGSNVGLAFASTGRVISQPAGNLGATALGIYITTSASTATASVATGMVTWPRSINQEA